MRCSSRKYVNVPIAHLVNYQLTLSVEIISADFLPSKLTFQLFSTPSESRQRW